ncbi:MAG TPA: WYL domain-containing protein [Acidimicrobiales bacterium]|nr:WYL domain-containing protein [Acidimicrobiales bacterium]
MATPHTVSRQPEAGVRLRRLLSMLAYLAGVREASIADVAERFAMTEDEVVAELELAACCGLPPYTPDQLIDLIVDADRVIAEGVGGLARPARLTPAEGFAIAAAARALLAVPGADPGGSLAGALAKLERALGEDRLVVDIDAPEHLPALRAAAAGGDQIEIEYLSAGRGELTLRVVDPLQVVMREGRWYMDAYCHRAEGLRRFQVDRVRSVRLTGEQAAPLEGAHPELDDPHAFVGGAEAIATVLAIPPRSVWIVDRFLAGPVVEREDGMCEVTVLVGGQRWLEQLLLRLGPRASVISPSSLAGVGAAGARRALRRYEST